MKIDAMIAGAQKAGTSSLKYYLAQHPDISTHTNLECDFFASKEGDFESYQRRYFEPRAGLVLAKYAHLYKEEEFVARLREHNPDCKIIFILRDPVDRLKSAYKMGAKEWIDFSGDHFQVALAKHENEEYDVAYNTLIKLGDYARAADLLYKYFPPQQVEFVSFARLKENPAEVVRGLTNFLSVAQEYQFKSEVQNAATSVRFQRLSSVLLALKKSPIARAAKNVVPYKVVHSVKNRIDTFNSAATAPDTGPIWNQDTEAALCNYYSRCNQRFNERTGLSIESLF